VSISDLLKEKVEKRLSALNEQLEAAEAEAKAKKAKAEADAVDAELEQELYAKVNDLKEKRPRGRFTCRIWPMRVRTKPSNSKPVLIDSSIDPYSPGIARGCFGLSVPGQAGQPACKNGPSTHSRRPSGAAQAPQIPTPHLVM